MFQRPAVQFGQYAGVQILTAGGIPSLSNRLDCDARALGQTLYSLREGQVFFHLNKLQDVAAGTAGKAFEYLLCRVDEHAGLVIGMKRAQTHHFLAFFFQIQVFRNDIDYVIGLLNPADQTIIPFPSQDISVMIAPSRGSL